MTEALNAQSPKTPSHPRRRWYLTIAVLLLLVAAVFRLWDLGLVPPGMHNEELINVQISDRLRDGDISVIYPEVEPAREVLYYAVLAVSSKILGSGLILWRMPSVWLAMLSLAVTGLLTRQLYGVRISLMALGLMAVTFWPVWMGRSIQHVTLMPLTTSATVFVLFKAFQSEEITESSLWFTVGGLAIGLSQYVHVTAWTLPVLFLAFTLYYALSNRQELRRHRTNIVFSMVLAVVIMLPLIIFIVRHPGIREPVPIAEQPQLITQIPQRLVQTLSALVLRGDMLPQHNLPGRPVLGPIIGMLMVIGIGVAIARWKQPTHGLALLWLGIGLIPAAFLPRQPDFEYMAVIMPIIYVFPAMGIRAIFILLRRWLKGTTQKLTLTLVGSVVVLLIIGNAVWTFQDYFLLWPTLGDVRLNYQADLGVLAHYLDTTEDPTPVSICSRPVSGEDGSFSLSNEDLLAYLMHRSDLPIRYFDCSQSLILANGGESQRLVFPMGHYYDSLPGPLLSWMRYAQDEQVPGIRPDVIMRIDVSEAIASYAGSFTTSAMAAWPPEAETSGLALIPASFGYNITLLGYDLRDDTLKPGDWVELTSYWRIDGPPPPDLMVFSHMLGNPVIILAQQDSLGVEVNTLQVRDIFLQYNTIQTPEMAVPGLYPLSIGLYLPDTGERLPVFFENAPVADRLLLRSVSLRR